ncbi:MAG: 16S rRNA (guanine(966)-N(2))-methyltransferase RsmD [Pseudomonadales bacterium]|nr:16S rRNA (guanine(966)-N(2))-methyltransferase RsmD [Pseudomonadales bacterium]
MSHRMSGRTVRIIGGNWRGRKVSFADHDDIRPTPSRIRETLFNWLQPDIHGARCLELYAGSGILSIEALSRGAREVTLVERSRPILDQIRNVLRDICPPGTQYHCIHASAADWLRKASGQKFDIVFLDPPFASDELAIAIDLIDRHELLADGAKVYIESGSAIEPSMLPEGWQLYRQKQAGQVHYNLVRLPA